MPATAVPSTVAYRADTKDADTAESAALKVIVAPRGDAMACAFDKLSTGSAAGRARLSCHFSFLISLACDLQGSQA